MTLHIPRHGLPNRVAGGAPGHLLVVVRTAPDSRFERDGTNLWRAEGVDVADAVLGTSLDVRTVA